MSSDRPADLSIGDVARLSGRSASTIRYYEEIGLLPEPRRDAGRRRYDGEVVRTLALVEAAQRAGFTLEEIGSLLGADDAADRLRTLAGRKLPEVAALIERSERVRTWLEHAARCGCASLVACPLFDGELLPL